MQSIWRMVDRLCCGLSIGDFFAPEPDAPKKDWFLYLMTDNQISRLNIDEFCKRGKSFEKFELELLYDYHHCDPSIKLPLNMEHTRVSSKVQMRYHRDEESDDSDEDDDEVEDDEEFEDGVHYCFDPTDPDGPSIRQCDNCDDFDLLHKAGFALEDKVYSFYPNFEVFDPLHQLWKRLLPTPTDQFEKIYALGHKLVFHNSHREMRESHMFDPRERIWVPVDWPNISKQTAKCVDGKLLCYYRDMIDIWTSNGMQAGVEHEGFLIAQLRGGDGLAAFRWGLDGVPKLYRVLDELDPIFRTNGKLLINSNYLSNAMGKCDGGRMWLVYNGYDAMHFCRTRIGVFRISVSTDLKGIPVLSAQVEAIESFSVGHSTSIKAAFALCHQPNQNEKKIRVFRHPSQCTVAS